MKVYLCMVTELVRKSLGSPYPEALPQPFPFPWDNLRLTSDKIIYFCRRLPSFLHFVAFAEETSFSLWPEAHVFATTGYSSHLLMKQ